jgi:hypothetical protein
MFKGPCIANMFQSVSNKMQNYNFFYYFCKLLYMFRVDPSPIIRSTKLYLQHLVFVRPLLLPAAIVEELIQFFISVNCSTCFGWIPHPSSRAQNCIYSMWYLSNRYCYLPLSWKSWVSTLPLCNVAYCWLYFGTWFLHSVENMAGGFCFLKEYIEIIFITF